MVVSVHGNYKHHSWLVLRKENFVQGALMVLFRWLFLRGIVKEVDEWIFVYSQAYGTIENFNVSEDRKSLVHNKVYVGKKVVKRKHEGFKIIYVGNFLKVKNQMFLLEVVKDLPVELTLVGKGYMKQRVMERVKELGIQDKVFFVESVPNEELHELLDEHDCFMSATLIEEISIPVIEAMSRGLPVLHRRPFERERIDVFHTGMDLVEFDVRAYRGELTKLMMDAKELRFYGAKGHGVWLRHRGELMEEREAQIYRRLLK